MPRAFFALIFILVSLLWIAPAQAHAQSPADNIFQGSADAPSSEQAYQNTGPAASPPVTITTFVSEGLGSPRALAVDGQDLIVADWNGRLLRVSPAGTVETIADHDLIHPWAVVADGDGFWVTDFGLDSEEREPGEERISRLLHVTRSGSVSTVLSGELTLRALGIGEAGILVIEDDNNREAQLLLVQVSESGHVSTTVLASGPQLLWMGNDIVRQGADFWIVQASGLLTKVTAGPGGLPGDVQIKGIPGFSGSDFWGMIPYGQGFLSADWSVFSDAGVLSHRLQYVTECGLRQDVAVLPARGSGNIDLGQYGVDLVQYGDDIMLSYTDGTLVRVHVDVPADNEAPTGTVVINSSTGAPPGARVTTTTFVALRPTLVGAPLGEPSDIAGYRLSQDGVTYSEWQDFSLYNDGRPYVSGTRLFLSGEDGDKTVYAQYRDLACNLSQPISDTIRLDRSHGAEFSLSINDASPWTNSTAVTLTIPAPEFTAEMQVSNDGGFAGAEWEPYFLFKAWEILPYGNHVLPRFVYARYRNADGVVSLGIQDDIILDQEAPTSSVEVLDNASSAITAQSELVPVAVQWAGDDDLSGIKGFDIQVQTGRGLWQDWLTQTTATNAVYYAQADGIVSFRSRAVDNAGNWEQYPAQADATVTVGDAPGGYRVFLPKMANP